MALKTTLSAEDIKKMFKAATCQRDQLILMFYAETGLRCSELLRVRTKDIDFERNTVLIPHLKRGIHKTCPKCGKKGGRSTAFCSKCGANMSTIVAEGISERTRVIEVSPALMNLIQTFIGGSTGDPEALLIGRSRQDVYHIIRSLATKAGLDGKVMVNPETGKSHYVHPHGFRDALAVDWLEKAGDNINQQKALQVSLGHSRFDTTLRYNKLTQAAVTKVRDEVRKARNIWED